MNLLILWRRNLCYGSNNKYEEEENSFAIHNEKKETKQKSKLQRETIKEIEHEMRNDLDYSKKNF